MSIANGTSGSHEKDAPGGERALVRAIGALLARYAPIRVSDANGPDFGDDMAPLPSAGPDSVLAWTTDMLMDGVDFRTSEAGWEAVGRKAMLVNLSDCAAMGGRPIAGLLALSLPRRSPRADVLKLVQGAAEAGAAHGCPVVGGDTNSWDGALVVAVTVAARREPHGRWLARSGAQDGDMLFVSGPLGGSILGRHLKPRPRIELGLQLAQLTGVHAAIDISDGLLIDLDRVCEASGCGAELDEHALQAVIHADARRLAERDGRSALEHALSDGEDFELLVAAAPRETSRLAATGLLPIGRIASQKGLWMRCEDGTLRELTARGWEHSC
ncbi:MAG: thiamine-phosphate kinase [Phycisphaerales bacterium]|nr:thiamine-phosphate kinase [Phycisphaerales bacterium]